MLTNSWKDRVPAVPATVQQQIDRQTPIRQGIKKADNDLWKFAQLLNPEPCFSEQQEAQFNRLLHHLSEQLNSHIKRETLITSNSLRFVISTSLCGSLKTGTQIKGFSNIDAVFILNSNSPCRIELLGGEESLYMGDSLIGYGIFEALSNAIQKSIDQMLIQKKFSKFNLKSTFDGFAYTFVGSEVEISVMFVLTVGGGIYYFVRPSDEILEADIEFSIKMFNELADKRKGLRDIVRCLKLTKRLWKSEETKIFSSIFDTAAYEIARQLNIWDETRFKSIWEECWKYILKKVVQQKPLPALYNPSSDLLQNLRIPAFTQFCKFMIEIGNDEQALLQLLANLYDNHAAIESLQSLVLTHCSTTIKIGESCILNDKSRVESTGISMPATNTHRRTKEKFPINLDTTIEDLIDEGNSLLSVFPFATYGHNEFEEPVKFKEFCDFEVKASRTVYQFCELIVKSLEGGKNIEALCLIWIKIIRILFSFRNNERPHRDIYVSHSDIQNESFVQLESFVKENLNMSSSSKNLDHNCQYYLLQSEYALITLSNSYFMDPSNVWDLLILRTRILHKRHLEKYPSSISLNGITEEPDRNLKVVLSKNFNEVALLDQSEKCFRELITSYKQYNYNDFGKEFFGDEGINRILYLLKPNEVQYWVFVMFTQTSNSYEFYSNQVVASAKIHRKYDKGKVVHTVMNIDAIHGKFHLNVPSNGILIHFESDTIRIGNGSFGRPIHGKTDGTIKIGEMIYKCFAIRTFIDPVKDNTDNLIELLKSKFPTIQDVLDFKTFANARCKCVVCITGPQDLSDSSIFRKIFRNLATSNPSAVRFCGMRRYRKNNITCGFYRILDWGVVLWFEEHPRNLGQFSKFHFLNPDALVFLQLRVEKNNTYYIIPIEMGISNELQLTKIDPEEVYKKLINFILFDTGEFGLNEIFDTLLPNFPNENVQVKLNQYHQRLLMLLSESKKISNDLKILGFELCYSMKPKPPIVPAHQVILSYSLLSVLWRLMNVNNEQNVDDDGYLIIKSKENYNKTMSNPSYIIDTAQNWKLELIVPVTRGSMFRRRAVYRTPAKKSLCNELQLMHFVSTVDDIPFHLYGFEVEELSWCQHMQKGWTSEVIRSKIERANQPKDLNIDSIVNSSVQNKHSIDSELKTSGSSILLYWSVANLSILDNWQSFGNPTPLRGESFIPLKFGPRNSKTVNSGSSDQQDSKTISMLLNQLESIIDEEAPHAILVQGHAGQGKTTLLRRLSFILPSQLFSKLFMDYHTNFMNSTKKFPPTFIQSFLNSLRTEIEDCDFTNKSIDDVILWIRKHEDEDLLLEYSAVFGVVLCKEIYKLLQSSKDFAEVWDFIKEDPSCTKFFSFKVMELLDYFVAQPENNIRDHYRWNVAALFLEYLANSKLEECSNIALFVRSDQLWQSRKLWELYDSKSPQFIQLVLKFHIENMKINDDRSSYKLLESDSLFSGMLNLLVENDTKIVLMMDAVDEVSIGERGTDEFKDFIKKILKLCKGNSSKIRKMIITGRYCCLQPIPERLDTVEILSLTRSQSKKYIQSLLKRWHKENVVENFPNQVINLKNKLNVEGSPLILLLLTRVCYLNRAKNGEGRENWSDEFTYYDVYEELVISLYDRCVGEKHSLLELVTGLTMNREWVLDMFSLFGYISQLVGAQQGVTVIRKCDIAFLFEQFRAEGHILPESKIDLHPVMKSSLPNEKWVKEDSCVDEYLVTWCMIALGIISSTSLNPNDRLDDIVQFHHKTFQEFLAARTLSRFEEIKASGSLRYPKLKNISIIENFNWTEDKFVCSDWWDIVRKFIVSKHGINFLARKIIPISSNQERKLNVQKWAEKIIENRGVDENDLGHVRLSVLLSCLPYCAPNDLIDSLVGHVLIAIGNSNANAMCSILEVSVGILKDSNGIHTKDQNADNDHYLKNICKRVFKDCDYEKFSHILLPEAANTRTAKTIKLLFENDKESEGQKQKIRLDTVVSPDISITYPKPNNQSIDSLIVNERTFEALSGKSSNELCGILADEHSAITLHKTIWEMNSFIPSLEELSANMFQQFPISKALISLSPSGKAVYLFYHYMKFGECDNCEKHLKERESIEKMQQLFDQYRENWPVEFIGKMLDWSVVLNGYWYPWIENLLETSRNARCQCGKMVCTLNTKRLLFCQPYFIHLSKLWRRFIKKSDTLIDADPLCRHDEVQYVSPPIDDKNTMDELQTADYSSAELKEDPIFEMCRKGREDQINKWLTAGNSPNVKTRNGDSLLHLAIRYGNLKVAQLLIDNGAIFSQNIFRMNLPLNFDMENGRVHAFCFGIENLADSRVNTAYLDAFDFTLLFKSWNLSVDTFGPFVTKQDFNIINNKPGDTTIIFIAGHGQSDNNPLTDFLVRTSDDKQISVQKLVTDLINTDKVKHIVLILDVCDAGNIEFLFPAQSNTTIEVLPARIEGLQHEISRSCSKALLNYLIDPRVESFSTASAHACEAIQASNLYSIYPIGGAGFRLPLRSQKHYYRLIYREEYKSRAIHMIEGKICGLVDDAQECTWVRDPIKVDWQ